MALHSDELRIDVPLVRALVDRDLPEHAALPLTPLGATGSTNALFRLGDDLLVRLPRQPGGSAGIDLEAKWLPVIGQKLPVAVPEVLAVGRPGFGYPERWSLVRWLEGSVPAVPGTSRAPGPPRGKLVGDLAQVVLAMRAVDVPASAVADPSLDRYRGRALAERDGPTRGALAVCRTLDGLSLDLDKALSVWEDAVQLPRAHQAVGQHWFHGDLFAENLLVSDEHLSGVLDFGGLGIGDPTIDLIVAWEVLDEATRDTFRQAVGADGATWLCARAWALSLALGAFAYYWQTMPGRVADKLAVAKAVLADACP